MRDVQRHLPRRLLRSEVRRRALRAATAVAVGAAAGCSASDVPVTGEAEPTAHVDAGAMAGVDAVGGPDGAFGSDTGSAPDADPGADASNGRTELADAGRGQDAGGPDTQAAGSPEAGGPDAGAPDAGASDSGGDAGGDALAAQVCNSLMGWEDYKRCCDDHNWAFNKGCMAWGPPAPPALSAARLAALLPLASRDDLTARRAATRAALTEVRT